MHSRANRRPVVQCGTRQGIGIAPLPAVLHGLRNDQSCDSEVLGNSPARMGVKESGTASAVRPQFESSTAFRAQSPNLRFASLMDMDFAVSCPLVRRWRLVSGFCSSTRTFVPCFLQTPPRGGSPCIITRPYLHQVGQRTFTSKLLSMPSTQRSRFAADAIACPEQATSEI